MRNERDKSGAVHAGPRRVFRVPRTLSGLVALVLLLANAVCGAAVHAGGPAADPVVDPATGLSASVPAAEAVAIEAPTEAVADAGEADDAGAALAARYWLLDPDRPATALDYCPGRYVLPEFPYPLDSDPDGFPIRGDAENLTYFLDGRMSLEGAVTLRQGNRTITGRRGSLDQQTGRGLMTGRVLVLEPDLVLEGLAARVDLESRAASLEGVSFLLPNQSLRGYARSIEQTADGSLRVSDGSFTRCEPDSRNWTIEVGSLELDEGEVFATARQAVVKVGPVPVLYTPYLRFPVRDERQSGVLFPDIGISEQDGLDIRVPYYLNLAPNYDATIVPRHISDRGTGLEGQFRHLTGWQWTTLTGALLQNDDLFDGTLTRDDFNRLRAEGAVDGDFRPADRWLFGVDHLGGFGDFTTVVDYRAVSDRDYFRDLGGDIGLSSRVELERRGELRYASGGLQARLWTQRFDRLDDGTLDPYQRLPQLDVRYDGQLTGPLRWAMSGQLASFDRDNEGLTGLDRAIGERVHLEPRVEMPFYWPSGFLTFAGGLRYTSYHLRQLDAAYDDSPERSVALGSVDAGLYFDRQTEAFGRPINQSLEPRLFYLYQGFDDQDEVPVFDASELTFGFHQLFRDNRFSGIDRIGDANQLALGLTTRLTDERNGLEYLRASLGQIRYFEDRRVTLDGVRAKVDRQETSAMAGELAGSLSRRWRVKSSIIWDPNLNEIDEGSVSMQYKVDDRRILNLGYRDRQEDDISQADFSTYWPLSRQFGFIGRWNYDIEQGRVIESFAGLEFNDCCWRIRVVARRFLNIPTGPNIVTGENVEVVRPDQGVFLQIVFKGMGGVGNGLESMLARGIRGYRSEGYDDF